MKKYYLVALSITGGILSGLAWTSWCTGLILLISLIPFMLIEDYLYLNAKKFSSNSCFLFTLPGFVIFSIIGIGWMRVASLTGAILVVIGLAFLMSFTFWLAHLIRLRSGNIAGFISLTAFWLSYEYLSLNINIISPWLNLGNGLAKDLLFIQWFEATGTAGGSLWILVSNLLLMLVIKEYVNSGITKKNLLAIWISIIIVPTIISISRYYTIEEIDREKIEAVIIQPNNDPYSEKFNIPFEKQLAKVISMADSAITGRTSWVLTPETTVDDPVNLDSLENDKYIKMLKGLSEKHPGISVVAGLVSMKIYPPLSEAPTNSARKTGFTDLFTDYYNSAFKIDTGKIIEYYHKSKLVPGIEMQFANGPGRLITKILPYLGGTKWGYGIQNERSTFFKPGSSLKIAPIICYESVFGEYVTEYVNNGAGVLFIITNDGWWKNTNGYKQHLSFASVRAIETRRPVVRAANTGVSCIIDFRGKREIESEWWKPSVIKGAFTPGTLQTPYVKYGDYLLRISILISVLLIIINFFVIPLRKKMNL